LTLAPASMMRATRGRASACVSPAVSPPPKTRTFFAPTSLARSTHFFSSSRLPASSRVSAWPGPPRSREELDAQLRAEMPDLEQRVREMTFCRLLGMMLGSGVPLLQALDVAANEVYPDGAQCAETLKRAVSEPPYALATAVVQLGFSRFTVQFVAVGEECGTLERMMDKAADLFQRELEVRMSAAMARLLEAPNG
jgi:hypothetical protein